MAQPGDTTTGQGRRAKARLSGMLTETVGIVDRAANAETFLVVKRADDMVVEAGAGKGAQKTVKAEGDAGAAAAATDPGATAGGAAAAAAAGTQAQKAPMKLPAAAKEAMLTGLSGALEKLSAVADMVNGAEVDDAAPVPAELGQALGEVAAILTGLGGGGDAKAAGDAAAAPGAGVEKAELDAYTAMHVTIDAARTRLWQAIEIIAKDPTKASEEIRAVADMLSTVSTMVPTAAAKAVASAVAKSGRKMSKGRLSLFKQAFDIMATLLKELEDEGEDAAAQAAAAGAQAAATQAAAPAAAGPLAKALDALSSFEPAKLAGGIGEVLSIAKSLQTGIASLGAKVQAHDIALAKAAKSVPLPNSNPVEGATSATKTPHTWCDDLAAKAREDNAASKGNGK